MKTARKVLYACIGAVVAIFLIWTATFIYNMSHATYLTNEAGAKRFQLIEGTGMYGQSIYVDTQTGVEYLVFTGSQGSSITALFNHNGSPMIAEGYFD